MPRIDTPTNPQSALIAPESRASRAFRLDQEISKRAAQKGVDDLKKVLKAPEDKQALEIAMKLIDGWSPSPNDKADRAQLRMLMRHAGGESGRTEIRAILRLNNVDGEARTLLRQESTDLDQPLYPEGSAVQVFKAGKMIEATVTNFNPQTGELKLVPARGDSDETITISEGEVAKLNP